MSENSEQLNPQPKIGLALGGGSARGWAHIGVIRALEDLGIKPDIICGSSIGALVGAAYAGNELDKLEDWVITLDWQKTLKFLDISFKGGFIEGKKLFDFFNQHVSDARIKDLPVTFAAVATNLENGSEVWIKEGSVMNAVRASIALPGLFSPVYMNNQWLADGGLVNPVPVTLCKALGADKIIAVDLISNLAGRYLKRDHKNNGNKIAIPSTLSNLWSSMTNFNSNKPLPENTGNISDKKPDNDLPDSPSLFDTIASAVNIIQIQTTKTNLAANPPAILIKPHLQDIGLLEFYRAKDAIEEGKKSVVLQSSEIVSIIQR